MCHLKCAANVLSFRSCDSCRRLPEPRHHSFLFSHWSSSKCLVFMAARIPSIHVFLGRPLFLLSPGIRSIINFGSLSSYILLTWPYYWSLFLSMMSTMSCFSFTPIVSFICSFFILSILDCIHNMINVSIEINISWQLRLKNMCIQVKTSCTVLHWSEKTVLFWGRFLFIYIPTLQLISQMFHFCETWYDQYDIWGHSSSVSFLISYTTNNYKADVQVCDMGAILASLASVSWNGIRL